MKRQTATVDCPKSMVGRVIGKSGETIKALQNYTGALIQIDQTVEPTRVTISGTAHSLQVAVSMVSDIVKGTFKGFALLRQLASPTAVRAGGPPGYTPARPVYAPGYGLIPPSQLYGGDDSRPPAYVLSPTPHMQMLPQGKKVGGWPAGVPPNQLLMGMGALGVAPGGQRPMARYGMDAGLDAYAMAGMEAYYPQPGMLQQHMYMPMGNGLDGMAMGGNYAPMLMPGSGKGNHGDGAGWVNGDAESGNHLMNELGPTSGAPVASGDMARMQMPMMMPADGYHNYMNTVAS